MNRSNRLTGVALAVALTLAAVSSALAAPPAQDIIELDPARTVIAFQLKGNLHTTHGSFQLKSGHLTLDPATGAAGGAIVIDAESATTQNGMRDAEMRDHVLESATYPEIIFVPNSIAAARTAAGGLQGTVAGTITIHGEQHPVTLEVSGAVAGDALTCQSNFSIPYAAWGMTNPSWLMFRVAGDVDVEFSTVARITWAAPDKSGSDQMKVPAR